MTKVLLVSDSAAFRAELSSALASLSLELLETDSGRRVRELVEEEDPELVVLDMQVGSMGGMAICMDLRLEESGGRLLHTDVLMIVDRRADVFLAKRSGAEGFLVKPINPIRLRKAVRSILDGHPYRDVTNVPYSVART